MKNQIDELETRISKQEQYSSKDTIIIDNLPIYDDKWPLLGNVLHFFDKFLDYKLQMADIKACHHLPKSQNQDVPRVIVKFLYFHHKMDICSRRVMLIRPEMFHPINKRPIYLRQRQSKTM